MSVSYLDELCVAGECAVEYLSLYQKLIKPTHWKVYLAARGVLPYIGNLITKVTAPTPGTISIYSGVKCSNTCLVQWFPQTYKRLQAEKYTSLVMFFK